MGKTHLRGGRVVKWKGRVASMAPIMIAGAVFMSYATESEATCIDNGGGNYQCSGTDSDTNISGSWSSMIVEADNSFSVESGGLGIGNTDAGGDISYSDGSGTSITGNLYVYGQGNNTIEVNGSLVGSVTIHGQGNNSLDLKNGSVIGDASSGWNTITMTGATNSLVIREGAMIAADMRLQAQYNSSDPADNVLTFDGGTRTVLTDQAMTGWTNLILDNSADITLGSLNPNSFSLPPDYTSSYESGYLNMDPSTMGIPSDPSVNHGLFINSGSTLRFELENFIILGNVTNSGIINMADGQMGFLTINSVYPADPDHSNPFASNYTSLGGSIALDAELGGNSSRTDRIIIHGDMTGSTTVYINNVGGTGEQTTGDGIEVIQIGGNSDGEFILTDKVVAGAYQYHLREGAGGNELANGKGGVSNSSWYLQSTLDAPDDTVDPEDSYHPAVPAYENYPQILALLQDLPTMHQRVGNRYWSEPVPVPVQTIYCKDASKNFQCPVTNEQSKYYIGNEASLNVDAGKAFWGRVEGSTGHFEPKVSTSGATYDYNMAKLQAGIDGLLSENENGRIIGGLNGYFGKISSDFEAIHGKSKLETTGYGLGATLTWLGNNGFYVDGQAQYSWFDTDISSRDLLKSKLVNGNNGTGYAFGLEVGKRIEVRPDWFITPQAQLKYSKVDFDTFTDSYGTIVSLDKGDSLRARLGMSLEHQKIWTDAQGQAGRSSVYGIANLYNEFLDESRVDVSGVSFDSRNDRLWGGLGLGTTVSWADNKYAVYGEASADTSLKNFADSYSFTGSLGFKVKW